MVGRPIGEISVLPCRRGAFGRNIIETSSPLLQIGRRNITASEAQFRAGDLATGTVAVIMTWAGTAVAAAADLRSQNVAVLPS